MAGLVHEIEIAIGENGVIRDKGGHFGNGSRDNVVIRYGESGHENHLLSV